MKKLLLAVPLIAGASWAGASYYTGAQTQSAYDQLLVQLNELKPFTLVNEYYTAGLSHSSAITKVMDSTSADAQVLFRLQHEIQHSPIGLNDGAVRVGAATIKTTVVRDDSLPESLVEFMDSFTDSDAVQINTQVSFNGDAVHQFLVSQYEHDYDGTQVRFDGVDYTASVSGDRVIGSGEIGEIVVNDDLGHFRMSPGVITTDLNRISQAVYSGSYGVEFEKLSLSGQALPSDLSFEKISLSSDTDLNGDKLSTRGGFAVGNIDSPLPVTSASINGSLTGMPLSGIQEYIAELSRISMMDQFATEDPEIMIQLMKAYKSLAAPGAGLSYDVKVGTQMGNADASYGISVIEQSSPNYPVGGFDSVATARDLLNMLKMEMHVNADAGVVDQTPLAMFMMSPEAQQFVISNGVTYSSDIVVSDLIVNINGNPMSLEIMAGEMLDMPLQDLMSM